MGCYEYGSSHPFVTTTYSTRPLTSITNPTPCFLCFHYLPGIEVALSSFTILVPNVQYLLNLQYLVKNPSSTFEIGLHIGLWCRECFSLYGYCTVSQIVTGFMRKSSCFSFFLQFELTLNQLLYPFFCNHGTVFSFLYA